MITDRLKVILEELSLAEEDAQKCEDGNASAGRRVRKASMNAIKELKELRALILQQIKGDS
tara:strand:- start:8 stop:190 length:183 start_codon:yes stop_codon:yes gene_type:complete